MCNSAGSFPHQRYCLFPVIKHIINVYKIVGKLVVTLCHKVGKNMQVMDAIKNNCLPLCKLTFSFQKFARHISIMHSRPQVMNNMVTIVPAGFIVHGINAIN